MELGESRNNGVAQIKYARKHLPLAALMACGIVLSVVLFILSVREWEKTRLQVEFNELAQQRAEAIRSRIDDCLEALQSVGGFYAASKEVEEAEFRMFVKRVLERHPEISALEWVPRVTHEERTTYELQIKEMNPREQMITAQAREEYFPVRFVEPFEENKIVHGFDHYSQASARKAMDKARDTGMPIATEWVRLVRLKDDSENSFGVLFFMPIYLNDSPHETLEDRRRNLVGFASAVFRIDEMAELSLAGLRPQGVNFYFYEEILANKGGPLYFHDDAQWKRGAGQWVGVKDVDSQPKLQWKTTFKIGRRYWSVLFCSTPEFFAMHKQWEQGAVLMLGLFLINLMIIHVFKILRHTVQVEQLMAEISKRNELINVEIKGRKKLEGQLLQSQKMEAMGRLAGGIAHDFNNIITVIRGYSDLVANSLGAYDPKRSDVEEIQKAAERGGGLTTQLLAFARRQAFDSKIVDINELIIRTDKMINRVLGEDINVITIYGRNLAMVKVDPGQLEQVVLNLTINARDAMPKGGQLTIETANVSLTDDYIIEHGGEMKAGEYVLLTISDTGMGMNDDVKKHIFEPFFTTKEEGKGTGLGLATSYGIVKQTGGFISVYSEVDKGTVFKIFLPSVEAAPTVLNGFKKSPQPIKGTETVLLVEDEKAVRDLSARVLSQHGYTVIEGIDGKDALHLAEENKDKDIRLLFTDLVMPQMGGKELADNLKTFFPKIKVLFTSGYSDRDVISQGLLERDTAFIQKPFSPQILLEKVREVLG